MSTINQMSLLDVMGVAKEDPKAQGEDPKAAEKLDKSDAEKAPTKPAKAKSGRKQKAKPAAAEKPAEVTSEDVSASADSAGVDARSPAQSAAPEPSVSPGKSDTPSPDDIGLDRFLCFSLYSASHAMHRIYRPLLQELKLTYPQYLAMVVLWEKNDQLVGDIGARLHLESNTMTPLLKRLEGLDLITRTRSTKDERQVRIKLTRKGHAMKQKTKNFAQCIVAATGIDPTEIMDLQQRITALRANLLANAARAADDAK